jgi:prefoldin subunit 5
MDRYIVSKDFHNNFLHKEHHMTDSRNISENEEEARKTGLAKVRPARPEGLMPLTGGVDKTDVVAIATTLYEQQLEIARSRLTEALKDLRADIEKGEKAVQDNAKAAAKSYDPAKVRDAALALKDAGFGAFDVKTELIGVDETKRTFKLTVKLTSRSRAANSYWNSDSNVEVSVPFDSSSKDVLKRIRGLRKQVEQGTNNLAEVHKRLANIGRVEREARAKLAEQALKKTDEGRLLLAQISRIGLKALPGFAIPGEKK